MNSVAIMRFPVVCPVCRSESIASLELASIAEAMLGDLPIILAANCHEQTWTAGEVEREQLRQYLAAGIWVSKSRASECAEVKDGGNALRDE